MTFVITSVDKDALGGKAMRKEVTVYFTGRQKDPKMDILIYLPNEATKPVPLFLGLNFNGNHAIHADPGITLAEALDADSDGGQSRDGRRRAARRPAAGRSSRSSPAATAWPRSTTATSIRTSTTASRTASTRCSTSRARRGPRPNEWGSIGAWAWGLSRAMDYLETDPDVDAKRVAVMGHSRLGKTALWAGAQDERFALVISNDSGCGGAALARRRFGETVERINTVLPPLVLRQLQEVQRQRGRPARRSAHADRPDRPAAGLRGQRRGGPLGRPARRVPLGPRRRARSTSCSAPTGLPAEEMPAVNQPVMGTIGYHIRPGKHDVTDYDWERYLDFADKHLKSKCSS